MDRTPDDAPPPQAPAAQAPPPAYPPPRTPLPAGPPAPSRPPGGFKRGFGLGAGAALGAGLIAMIVGVVGFALLAGLLALVGSTVSSAPSTTEAPLETVWGPEDAGTTIREIAVTGPILTDSGSGGIGLFGLGTYGYDVAEQLDAMDKGDADAVLLSMDTPGGTITGSKAIADAVERYQQRTGRPVVAFVRGMSASGGMYAMSGADEVIADYGTMIGSIGVILGPLQRYRDVTAIEGGLLGGGVTTDGGITSEYFTKGKGKDFGNPWRAITPQERRVISAGMDDEYAAFVRQVSEGRGIPERVIRQDIGAYIYSPQQAIDNGLVDRQMGADEAFRRIATIAGGDPDDARVVAPAPLGFLESLTSAGSDAEPTQAQLDRAASTIRRSEVCAGSAGVMAVHVQVANLCR